MTALAYRAEPEDMVQPADGQAAKAVRAIADRFATLGAEITDISGRIGDVTGQVEQQSEGLHRVLAAVEQVSRANLVVQNAAASAQGTASVVRQGLARVTGEVRRGLSSAQADIETLADGARSMSEALAQAVQDAHRVRASSDAIQSIAREIQLLAINAGVEAARSGAAGRGFAVIAAAVKHLAEQTREATVTSAKQLDALVRAVDDLARASESNSEAARHASQQSAGISQRIGELDSFGASVVDMIAEIDAISGPSAESAEAFRALGGDLAELVDGVDLSSRHLAAASKRTQSLIDASEDILGAIADSGVRTAQSELIDVAIGAAAEVAALFERALLSGEIAIEALFDEAYQPIPGSDPLQHMTRFVPLTDRVLPAVQERLLASDRRVVFCAAVDRNGFLPTHNRKYSQPQGHDPVWNNANCRNRRIFADRTGLAAARNRKPFLLQTYRRDMGGGEFLVMQDLSAPIMVRGRHWGGFRFGLSV